MMMKPILLMFLLCSALAVPTTPPSFTPAFTQSDIDEWDMPPKHFWLPPPTFHQSHRKEKPNDKHHPTTSHFTLPKNRKSFSDLFKANMDEQWKERSRSINSVHASMSETDRLKRSTSISDLIPHSDPTLNPDDDERFAADLIKGYESGISIERLKRWMAVNGDARGKQLAMEYAAVCGYFPLVQALLNHEAAKDMSKTECLAIWRAAKRYGDEKVMEILRGCVAHENQNMKLIEIDEYQMILENKDALQINMLYYENKPIKPSKNPTAKSFPVSTKSSPIEAMPLLVSATTRLATS